MPQVLGLSILLENAVDEPQSIRARWLCLQCESSLGFREPLQRSTSALNVRVALRNRSLSCDDDLGSGATQSLGNSPQQQKVLPRHALRTTPANKLDAPILPNLGTAPHQHHPDLRGALDVRSAAGLQVGSFDFNRAQDSGALHFLAHSKLGKLLRGAIAYGDSSVLENHQIRGTLRTLQDLLRRLAPSQIDGADFTTEVK